MSPYSQAVDTLAVEPLLECVALSKTYRGSTTPALDALSLSIPRGSFFGLLGPNGAGKTTLISILCGLIAPDAGSITCAKDSKPRAGIGLVPQELAFYPTLSVAQNLDYFAALHGLQGDIKASRIELAIAIGQLSAVRSQRAETLSGGLKRRLNLAIGVLDAPRLLVLDEPTVGVDAQSRRHLQEELRRLHAAGTTLLYTSHYLDEVQALCDRLAVIDHGRLIAIGPTSALLQQDVVTLRTRDVLDARTLETLRMLADVQAVRQDGCVLALVTAQREQTLASALQVLHTRNLSVLEAGFGAQNLETLFFQLTGAQLRDDTSDHANEPAGR